MVDESRLFREWHWLTPALFARKIGPLAAVVCSQCGTALTFHPPHYLLDSEAQFKHSHWLQNAAASGTRSQTLTFDWPHPVPRAIFLKKDARVELQIRSSNDRQQGSSTKSTKEHEEEGDGSLVFVRLRVLRGYRFCVARVKCCTLSEARARRSYKGCA